MFPLTRSYTHIYTPLTYTLDHLHYQNQKQKQKQKQKQSMSMMTIIPCIHNRRMSPEPQSSPHCVLSVQTSLSVFDRLIHYHPNGQIAATETRLRLPPTLTRPFNPLSCPNCQMAFLDCLLNNLGYSPAAGFRALHAVICRVETELANLERRRRHHHDALLERVVVNVPRVNQLHVLSGVEFGGMSVGRRCMPASEAAIRALERVEYEEMIEDGWKWKGDNCAICLEKLGPAATKAEQAAVLRLPCQHVLHHSCIREWLRRNHFCPLCRFHLPHQTP